MQSDEEKRLSLINLKFLNLLYSIFYFSVVQMIANLITIVLLILLNILCLLLLVNIHPKLHLPEVRMLD